MFSSINCSTDPWKSSIGSKSFSYEITYFLWKISNTRCNSIFCCITLVVRSDTSFFLFRRTLTLFNSSDMCSQLELLRKRLNFDSSLQLWNWPTDRPEYWRIQIVGSLWSDNGFDEAAVTDGLLEMNVLNYLVMQVVLWLLFEVIWVLFLGRD